jgi:hypothetical protein
LKSRALPPSKERKRALANAQCFTGVFASATKACLKSTRADNSALSTHCPIDILVKDTQTFSLLILKTKVKEHFQQKHKGKICNIFSTDFAIRSICQASVQSSGHQILSSRIKSPVQGRP